MLPLFAKVIRVVPLVTMLTPKLSALPKVRLTPAVFPPTMKTPVCGSRAPEIVPDVIGPPLMPMLWHSNASVTEFQLKASATVQLVPGNGLPPTPLTRFSNLTEAGVQTPPTSLSTSPFTADEAEGETETFRIETA